MSGSVRVNPPIFRSSVNTRQRRRSPGGIQLQTLPDQSIFSCLQTIRQVCADGQMQNSKELMKQTFGYWKLTLNDDKWDHIIAENDPEERKRQRKKIDRTARMLGAHRNALGTFDHDQKHGLMAARKAWFKLSRKFGLSQKKIGRPGLQRQ